MYSLELNELSLQETKEINGGVWPAYIAAKYAAAIVAGAYGAGLVVGELLYNVTH
jgi:lactobin A/cerein 7B family class IIb bacteriocin